MDAVVIGDEDAHAQAAFSIRVTRPCRAQRLRHRDRAVGVLIGLQHRHQRAADRDARAVQRVDEAGVLAALRPVARIHAAGLEVAADRAGRDLADRRPGRAARPRCRRSSATPKPMSPVHSARCGRRGRGASAPPRRRPSCARARRATAPASVMETSSTLVNWCWRIMPRVSRPAEPASARKQGVQRGEAQRQLLLVEDLLADEVGERTLRPWG